MTGIDIDLMSEQIVSGINDSLLDLNADAIVDLADRDALLNGILGATYGNANLDVVFDSADLLLVFQGGQFENMSKGTSAWIKGDWSGDGKFDTSDLVLEQVTWTRSVAAAINPIKTAKTPRQLSWNRTSVSVRTICD